MNPRTCIVTREEKTPDQMIRFVVGPDEEVVPDLKHKLPGRGVWVTANRAMILEAVEKGSFARGFKRKVKVEKTLPLMVQNLLRMNALSLLSMACKAGILVTGQKKVEELLKRGKAKFIIQAEDSTGDGKRKLTQMTEVMEENQCELLVAFTSEELDKALGGVNTVHIGMTASGLTDKIKGATSRYLAFHSS